MKKRWLFFLLKLIIALITMLLLFTQLDFREISSALQNPQNPIFILLALFLLIPNLFLQLFRWHYLLRTIQPDVYLSESLGSLLGGVVVGFITPGRVGEMGRSLFLKNTDRWQAFGLAFIDKLYSLLTILIGGIWGITLLISYLFNYEPFIVWPFCSIALMITLGGVGIALHPHVIRSLLYNLSLLLPHRDKMKRLISCMDQFQKKQARILFTLSFLLYAIYILQFSILAFAFQRVPWHTVLTVTTSTFFTKTLLPISLADLGIREGAAVYFFMKFHVDKITAFNSAILLFTINVLIPTILGLFFLPRLGWREGQNSKMK